MKIVLVTGGFDPIHSGHIAYFESAKKLGDKLIVGLNSDSWLARKKGRPFLPIWERDAIIRNLKMVDMTVMVADDPDNGCGTFIKETLELFPNDEIIFANGGDRTEGNIPEMQIQDPRLSFAFGVGGEDKKNSSSWILKEWQSPTTARPWGEYRVLHDLPGCKVKELVIEPGKSMSMQRHFSRSEHWYVLKGQCQVEIINGNESIIDTIKQNHSYVIGQSVWHRGFNNSSEPCHILEVQHGEMCVEEDIERM
jgi:cytidyltransferase-like protein